MISQQQSIYHNGRIFTAVPEQPYAEAMAVENGKITWLGTQEESERLPGERIDLKSRRVIPGLIDAHLHPLYLANAAKQVACASPLVESITDLIGEIENRREVQQMGEWIEGWGYDEGKLAEGRSPQRWDLDKAVTDSPVVLTRTCGHIVSVNSKALELAGITKDTPNPKGGQIDRDASGEPTGILRESARELIFKVMPGRSIEEDAQSIADMTPFLFSHGITSITDMLALAGPTDYIDLYETAQLKGFAQRISLYYVWEDLEKKPMLTPGNTNRTKTVHIGGIKLFGDGSVSGRTAWVDPSYIGAEDENGISTTSKEELLAAAEMAKQHGVQIAVHAMGEQAIDQIVNAFAEVDSWIEDGPSVRIEHVAMPTPNALKLAAEKGIAFVPQTVFLFAEIESYQKNLGIERTKTTYPVKSMLDAGITVGLSSDAPATAWADPVNPFVGIQSAVTRIAYNGEDTGQAERISVEKAIELYTRGAAEVTRLPFVGQLKPGFHADFVVLDQDILNVAPEKIGLTKALETYFNGQRVYEKKTDDTVAFPIKTKSLEVF